MTPFRPNPAPENATRCNNFERLNAFSSPGRPNQAATSPSFCCHRAQALFHTLRVAGVHASVRVDTSSTRQTVLIFDNRQTADYETKRSWPSALATGCLSVLGKPLPDGRGSDSGLRSTFYVAHLELTTGIGGR
jgi:hypothetical protein